MFEPPAPPDYPDAAKFTPAPPPYVLNPPLTGRRAFRPGEELPFEMVLIGPAREALPYFIYTFIELGRRGLGSRRGKYELAGVDLLREVESTRIYDGKSQTLSAYPSNGRVELRSEDAPTGALTLHLLTPLRLKVKGDLVTELTFPLFFDRLAHRITLLAAFYGPGTLPPDPAPLLARATDITAGPVQLHWYDWERYSSRQKDTMKFGGLRGRITFSGPLSPFMPWLRLGEQVNVGQSTTFGLGRYRMG